MNSKLFRELVELTHTLMEGEHVYSEARKQMDAIQTGKEPPPPSGDTLASRIWAPQETRLVELASALKRLQPPRLASGEDPAYQVSASELLSDHPAVASSATGKLHAFNAALGQHCEELTRAVSRLREVADMAMRQRLAVEHLRDYASDMMQASGFLRFLQLWFFDLYLDLDKLVGRVADVHRAATAKAIEFEREAEMCRVKFDNHSSWLPRTDARGSMD